MDDAGAGLDEHERRLLGRLPAPPPLGDVAMSHLWIVEWLGDDEPKSGTELCRWLDARRKGWPRLVACRGKRDVVSAIKAAMYFARNSGARPVLHLEAGCGAGGLEAPAPAGTREVLPWSELARHLRRLNVATRCNLVLAVRGPRARAAAGLLASGGDRIPCAAVIGPDRDVPAAELLAGSKTLYRNWMDGTPGLESASRRIAPARMGADSMVALAHALLLRQLVRATRPGSPRDSARRFAALMATMGWRDHEPGYPPPWPLLPRRMHRLWQSLFMLDLYPENRARFDFDARAAAWDVLRFRGIA